MNNLSWFLYGAGVVNNLSVVLVLVGVILSLCALIGTIVTADNNSDVKNFPRLYPNKTVRSYALPKSLTVWAFVAFLVVAILPSKSTMYLIAGSEAGEAVVTSQEGQKIIKDIQDVISAQLENLKKAD